MQPTLLQVELYAQKWQQQQQHKKQPKKTPIGAFSVRNWRFFRKLQVEVGSAVCA